MKLFTLCYIPSEMLCVFYTYSISHDGLATFQVFNGYMWLVISILDRAALEP